MQSLGTISIAKAKSKPLRRIKRANTQLVKVEDLFNTKDTWTNLASYGRRLVDSGDCFLAVRVLEQSVRNWLEEKELEKEKPSGAPPPPLNALLNSSGRQSNKKTIREIEKKMVPETPELAGIIHLLMHMLMKNKDWSGVVTTAEFLLESDEVLKQLTEAERDDLRLRKAVATHTIEFKKRFGTSLDFETVKANFQQAHPGYRSKHVAARGLKHLAFLQTQAQELEREAALPRRRGRLQPISGPPPERKAVQVARPRTP